MATPEEIAIFQRFENLRTTKPRPKDRPFELFVAKGLSKRRGKRKIEDLTAEDLVTVIQGEEEITPRGRRIKGGFIDRLGKSRGVQTLALAELRMSDDLKDEIYYLFDQFITPFTTTPQSKGLTKKTLLTILSTSGHLKGNEILGEYSVNYRRLGPGRPVTDSDTTYIYPVGETPTGLRRYGSLTIRSENIGKSNSTLEVTDTPLAPLPDPARGASPIRQLFIIIPRERMTEILYPKP